ncbi:MAG: hypothetical protein L6Q38_06475, partial [Nitrospira sp.]|nr:hypothetical protein [Nitrospira sp.]
MVEQDAPPMMPPSTRRPAWPALAILLALAIAGYLYWQQTAEAPAPTPASPAMAPKPESATDHALAVPDSTPVDVQATKATR